jgi:hypothetical protein
MIRTCDALSDTLVFKTSSIPLEDVGKWINSSIHYFLKLKEIKKNLIYLPLFEIPFIELSLKKDLPVVDPIKVFHIFNDILSINNSYYL